MKTSLIFLLLVFTLAASAQTDKLVPIDQSGWRMLNYDPTVTGLDTGRVISIAREVCHPELQKQ